MLIFVLDSINTLFNLFLQFYYSDFQFGKEKKNTKLEVVMRIISFHLFLLLLNEVIVEGLRARLGSSEASQQTSTVTLWPKHNTSRSLQPLCQDELFLSVPSGGDAALLPGFSL